MSETSFKGELALMKVLLRAAEKRVVVSRPVTDFSRYDLVVDVEGKLHRVQVKYADGKSPAQTTGSASARLYSVSGGKKKQLYDFADVDAFIIYMPATDKVYWVPIEMCAGKSFLYLRYEPARNGQRKYCLAASDFEW
jgi:PD-(D/E)XK endonuclease